MSLARGTQVCRGAAERGVFVTHHVISGDCCRLCTEEFGLSLPIDFSVISFSVSAVKESAHWLYFHSENPRQISPCQLQQGAEAWGRAHAQCWGAAHRSWVLSTARGIVWAATDSRWVLAAQFYWFMLHSLRICINQKSCCIKMPYNNLLYHWYKCTTPKTLILEAVWWENQNRLKDFT